MGRKPDDTNHDQIDRHNEIEQPWHEQNENSSDQGDNRADKFRVEGWHPKFPRKLGQSRPIRELDGLEHKRSGRTCRCLKRTFELAQGKTRERPLPFFKLASEGLYPVLSLPLFASMGSGAGREGEAGPRGDEGDGAAA